MNQDHYIVIIAGGSGTRLWPLSRKNNPKQFHALLSEKTLLEETIDRAKQVVHEEHIFISTTDSYVRQVKEIFPHIPDSRLIIEPLAQGTAPAITLVAKTLHLHNPKAVVATLVSDHAIQNPTEFVDALKCAFEVVEKNTNSIATIGINPTFPSTELGYIKMGEELQQSLPKRTFFVESFKEKPDEKTARQYLTGWEYLWNAGYFIFTTDTFLHAAQTYIPQTLENIDAMLNVPSSDKDAAQKKVQFYNQTINEPIDTAIIEKLPVHERLVIPSELEWSDIGSWQSLFNFLQEKNASSIISKGDHIDFASSNCLVFGKEKTIATLGLDNIVIIETDDAILVADKQKTNTIKELLKEIEKKHKNLL